MGDKSFYYEGFNLSIKSEINIQELVEIDKAPEEDIDVCISFGPSKPDIINKINEGLWQGVMEDIAWIKGDDCAIFTIIGENEIVITPLNQWNEERARAYILSIVFTVILTNIGRTVFHAGAASIDGEGVMIIGAIGSGKSSLVSQFKAKGYSILSDDITGLDKNGKKGYIINRSFPIQRITEDMMESLGYNKLNYKDVILSRKKYIIPFKQSVEADTAQLKSVFYLEEYEGNKVIVEKIYGSEKLKLLVSSLFNSPLMADSKKKQECIIKCIEISKSVKLFKIKRPKGIVTVEDQYNLIKEIISNIEKGNTSQFEGGNLGEY